MTSPVETTSLYNLRKNIVIQEDYTLRTSLLFQMKVLQLLMYCWRLLLSNKYTHYHTLNLEESYVGERTYIILCILMLSIMFQRKNYKCMKNKYFLEPTIYLFYKFYSFEQIPAFRVSVQLSHKFFLFFANVSVKTELN
jgi:hypothetical protein